MLEIIMDFLQDTGFAHLTWQNLVMIAVSLIFLYLAIAKGFEPYLLVPIAFGMLLVNLPITGIFSDVKGDEGLLYGFYKLLPFIPPLIFLCVGASTDFGPLIANPSSLLLGAAAQFGIFFAFLGAIALGFNGGEASSIGIIGGADGPTAIFLTTKLAPELLGAIAVAAYSYMALVPIIQPPIIKMLTTEKERKTVMTVSKQVSKRVKVLFPIIVTLLVVLLLPTAAPLVGMLMLGNLLKESGVVPNIVDSWVKTGMYLLTIILGLAVGAKSEASVFLTPQTLKITGLGLVAFAVGTASGVLFGKLMYIVTKGKVNPMIGAAGVSAVPMAARVVQKIGQKENPSNFLLMHAMGPNVAGVIGSAVAAGVLLSVFGG